MFKRNLGADGKSTVMVVSILGGVNILAPLTMRSQAYSIVSAASYARDPLSENSTAYNGRLAQ